MRATLALIRFELERQWLVPAVGLVIGCAIVLLPYFPGGPSRVPAVELRTVATGISVVTYVLLLSLSLGASLIARDLAEHRASFLFSRPLGAASIAFGRLAAAFLLLSSSAALIVGPALVANANLELPTLRHESVEGSAALLAFAGVASVSLLLVSWVVLAARARTVWIVLELSSAIACALLVLRAFDLLRIFFLESAPQQLAFALAFAAPVVLLAIYLAPFLSGRTDLARAHRAQAVVAGLLLPLIGAGSLGWTLDYLNPSVDEVVAGALFAEPLGNDRFALLGTERDRNELMATVLIDARSGASRLASPLAREQQIDTALVERAGETLYWPDFDQGRFRLNRSLPLSGGFRAEPTAVEFDRFPEPWAISSDGKLFAGVESVGGPGASQLVVQEIETGRVVASRRLPVSARWNCRIEAETDGFRLLAWAPEVTLQSWRIEPDGSATRTASVSLAELDFIWLFDFRSSRVFMRQTAPKSWVALDSRTLETLFRLRPSLLDQHGTTLMPFPLLLEDGSVAVSVRDGERREISLYSSTGELLGTTSWTGPARARIVGLGRERAVLVAVHPTGPGDELASEDDGAGWVVRRIDLSGGAERELARELYPIRSSYLVRPGPALLRADDGKLFSLDADSGELRALPRAR